MSFADQLIAIFKLVVFVILPCGIPLGILSFYLKNKFPGHTRKVEIGIFILCAIVAYLIYLYFSK